MVGKVGQNVSPFRGLQVATRLVAVKMAVAHCVVLEVAVPEGAHDQEAFLRRLLRLQLELLDAPLRVQFGPYFPHLETEVRSLRRN